MRDRRRSPDANRVVPLDSPRLRSRTRPIGLTDEEREILLAELAEIAAELDELQTRTAEIRARVNRASPHRTGAA